MRAGRGRQKYGETEKKRKRVGEFWLDGTTGKVASTADGGETRIAIVCV